MTHGAKQRLEMTEHKFKPVEEQLAYIKKGVAEIIPNLSWSRSSKPRAKLGSRCASISASTPPLRTFTSGTLWSYAS